MDILHKKNYLDIIKSWLAQQLHLNPRTDDEFLYNFFECCKFRLELVKEKLDFYFTFRTLCPEYYQNRVPVDDKIRKLIETNTFVYLPKKNPFDNSRIFIIRFINIQTNNCSVLDIIRMCLIVHDQIGFYDKTLIYYGASVIVDLKGVTFSICHQILPHIKKLIAAIQNAYPFQIVNINFVNIDEAPQIFSLVLKTFQKLMKSKIVNRFLVHNNMESLHKHISKSVIPTEYGGQAGTLNFIMIECKWYDRLLGEEAVEWLRKDAKYKSIEENRIGKFRGEDLFGVEGSFKQLNID